MEYENSFRETVKSAAAADSYRSKGNALYKQLSFHAALVEYNKSICCAPEGSKELGMAYANRSAIYFEVRMYRKCVENINLARVSNYPAEKLKLLNDREEKCNHLIINAQSDSYFDIWDFFKLSYKPNKKIPFIIDGLELDGSEKYGRTIVTTRDLKAGNIIAIEEPFFKVLDDIALMYRCSFCLKNNHYSLIPCKKCPKVMYCTEGCRQKDFQLHQIGCQKPLTVCESMLPMPEKMVFGSIRILGSESEALALLNERKVKTVFDVDFSDLKAADYEAIVLRIVNTLSKKTALNYEPPSRNQLRELRQHFKKISDCNSFQFGEYSHEKHPDGKFKLVFSKCLGFGLFAFASLFNHSCYPNVIHVMIEGKSVVVVARPIKAGEQLFISYGPIYSTEDPWKRKIYLFNYGFDCDCIACINNYPKITELERCDRKFVAPKILTATRDAISQFRKNCDYINKHSTLPPSFEIAYLYDNNIALLSCIARRTLNDFEVEDANFSPPINIKDF